ncbi:MAG: ATP cone domain-containing protein [Patescibacteria group bacterium]
MINVIKANGEKEPFSEEKVRSSIGRAGIPKNIEDEVLSHVVSEIRENITTAEIYKHIIEFLDKSSEPNDSIRYSLKQAIMDLGPTGYPFEDYVSEILKAQGYQTKVRQILEGRCVTHEIDVVAEKDGKKIIVEAKYHNGPGIKSDVHVALYTKARFDDLSQKHGFAETWIITNTKLTQDALQYSLCSGVKAIGWNHPQTGSLRELVEEAKLYPVTSVRSLTQSQKQTLLLNQIVLCKNICINPAQIKILGLNPDQEKKVLDELNYLCKISN